MCDCNQELRQLIVEEIERAGRMTFARFMDMALYQPGLGYYASPAQRLGKEGDFYTSPHVHSAFGQMLARQIEEMWRIAGAEAGFKIVEFGAGSGLLAYDVLAAMSPDFRAVAQYAIIEVNPYMVEVQRKRLAELALNDGQVRWIKDLRELGEGQVGCVLSNELIDAFPVHRVKRKGRKLHEVYVSPVDGQFCEVLDEPSTPKIKRYLSRYGVKLAEGQETEVNLAALEWLEGVARFLTKGFVLSIDYGYESADLAGRKFFGGTLLGYRQHKLSYNPYQAIGRQDLTAHANFTALMKRGEELGLAITGLTSQMKFLLALMAEEGPASVFGRTGPAAHLADGAVRRHGGAVDAHGDARSGASALEAYRDQIALKQLVMPGAMGEVFKVLVQHKGVERVELTGLKSPW